MKVQRETDRRKRNIKAFYKFASVVIIVIYGVLFSFNYD